MVHHQYSSEELLRVGRACAGSGSRVAVQPYQRQTVSGHETRVAIEGLPFGTNLVELQHMLNEINLMPSDAQARDDSLNSYVVVFRSRSDANAAITHFNGCRIPGGGVPLKVYLLGGDAEVASGYSSPMLPNSHLFPNSRPTHLSPVSNCQSNYQDKRRSFPLPRDSDMDHRPEGQFFTPPARQTHQRQQPQWEARDDRQYDDFSYRQQHQQDRSFVRGGDGCFQRGAFDDQQNRSGGANYARMPRMNEVARITTQPRTNEVSPRSAGCTTSPSAGAEKACARKRQPLSMMIGPGGIRTVAGSDANEQAADPQVCSVCHVEPGKYKCECGRSDIYCSEECGARGWVVHERSCTAKKPAYGFRCLKFEAHLTSAEAQSTQPRACFEQRPWNSQHQTPRFSGQQRTFQRPYSNFNNSNLRFPRNQYASNNISRQPLPDERQGSAAASPMNRAGSQTENDIGAKDSSAASQTPSDRNTIGSSAAACGEDWFRPFHHKPTYFSDMPRVDVPIGEEAQVVVSETVSVGDFYVQLKMNDRDIIQQSRNINKEYQNMPIQTLFEPKIGEIVAVLDDGCWYRGVILEEKTKQKEYACRLIDMGDLVSPTTSFDSIRPISKPEQRQQLLSLPIQAIHCKLIGVAPLVHEETWSELSRRKFASLAEADTYATFHRKVSNGASCADWDMWSVSLTRVTGSLDCNHAKILVEMGLVRSVNETIPGAHEQEVDVTGETEESVAAEAERSVEHSDASPKESSITADATATTDSLTVSSAPIPPPNAPPNNSDGSSSKSVPVGKGESVSSGDKAFVLASAVPEYPLDVGHKVMVQASFVQLSNCIFATIVDKELQANLDSAIEALLNLPVAPIDLGLLEKILPDGDDPSRKCLVVALDTSDGKWKRAKLWKINTNDNTCDLYFIGKFAFFSRTFSSSSNFVPGWQKFITDFDCSQKQQGVPVANIRLANQAVAGFHQLGVVISLDGLDLEPAHLPNRPDLTGLKTDGTYEMEVTKNRQLGRPQMQAVLIEQTADGPAAVSVNELTKTFLNKRFTEADVPSSDLSGLERFRAVMLSNDDDLVDERHVFVLRTTDTDEFARRSALIARVFDEDILPYCPQKGELALYFDGDNDFLRGVCTDLPTSDGNCYRLLSPDLRSVESKTHLEIRRMSSLPEAASWPALAIKCEVMGDDGSVMESAAAIGRYSAMAEFECEILEHKTPDDGTESLVVRILQVEPA